MRMPWASSLPSGETGLRTSSVLPSRRGSFRVATTVPTTRARIICRSGFRLLAVGGLGLADRQHVFQTLVRTRDHVDRDQLAHAPGRGGTGIGGRAARGDVAAHHRGNVARADFLPADQVYLGGLFRSEENTSELQSL